MKTLPKETRPAALVYELPDRSALVALKWHDGMETVIKSPAYKAACNNYRVWACRLTCLPFKE